MARITVNFRSNERPLITDRRFTKGQGVSIWGTVTGVAIPEPFSRVTLDIPETGEHQETKANIWGDYAFFYRFPDKDGKLTLRLNGILLTGAVASSVIPVLVGNPAKVTAPDPVPEPENSANGGIIGAVLGKGFGENLGKYLAIGAGLVLIIYALPFLLKQYGKS